MHPATVNLAKQISAILAGRRPGYIFGPSNAADRAAILSLLTGQKVPKSKAGITAMMQALYQTFGVSGACIAVRESNLALEIEELANRQ